MSISAPTDMKPRVEIKKILILGSGGLRIGQAGEFDYSGSQAIKACREEGIQVVLVNPNIATNQTNPEMADVLYLEPLNIQSVSQIIEKEKPDSILLGFGGQTALNLGLQLELNGVLAKNQVNVLGTSLESIRLAEDRALFKQELEKIGIKTPHSICVTSVEDALRAASQIGYPVMLRSGYSLGGLGSGIINNDDQLKSFALKALSAAPQILIEEYLHGWSEFEYEIVRDCAGNAVTVCNMENIDPMGIHTGESIVVSPSQSLDNREYHQLREIAIRVADHFNIIGECNIQYAYNLQTRDYRVIEINPRLSRSSALASKATGYPLAFIAAKLALGYQLYELQNSVTKTTTAFFEPALDYIVVKIPRWDTQKLKHADRHITSEMKSVGEVMAIGRSFPEALQKAIGMLNIGATDLANSIDDIAEPEQEIKNATDRRIFAIYQFLRQGGSIGKIHELSKINLWFLEQIEQIVKLEQKLQQQPLDAQLLRTAKQFGFSDQSIAMIYDLSEAEVRSLRLQNQIIPVVKQIDTLAGEFCAQTNYLYLTYHGTTYDVRPSPEPAVIILGSGPYSIGSSVEFDWCAVTTARTLRKMAIPSIIINSNPETVSTDYDESDRLYFEQLSFERVQDIADFENYEGIIVAMGGQIANNLVPLLADANYKILGTSPESIKIAENRAQFSMLLSRLNIDQPAWQIASTLDKAKQFANSVGYPVLIRPSFVLSGAAMNVVSDEQEMEQYLQQATKVSPNYPVVISHFIENAKELELDGVANHGEIIIDAISEHVENAGVHSGDATIVLPPQRLYLETIRQTKSIARRIVHALSITGPFNMQFIAKNNLLQVIECNLRASRSFPFVSKVTNHNFIEIATQVIMDRYQPKHYETLELNYVGIKTPQFSYNRLKGANPVAHVEMASTGEVACLGDNFIDAFYRSWLATEQNVHQKKIFISIGGDKKHRLVDLVKRLDDLDWEIYATEGTHDYFTRHGIGARCVYKVSEGNEPNAATILEQHKIDLVINIPQSHRTILHQQITDGFKIRRLAIDHHIPLITNLQLAKVILHCLAELHGRQRPVKSWQEYVYPAWWYGDEE